jgi:hypothetical protein
MQLNLLHVAPVKIIIAGSSQIWDKHVITLSVGGIIAHLLHPSGKKAPRTCSEADFNTSIRSESDNILKKF